MKSKVLSILLTTILVSSLVVGCGKSNNNSSSSSSDSNVIYGQVTSVSDDSITINVGTMKEMSDKPDVDSNNSSANHETKSENGKPDGMPSMLDLTDESKTIKVSSRTTISKPSELN